LHRAGYYLNSYYYYPNKLDIELDETFREGLTLITCIRGGASKVFQVGLTSGQNVRLGKMRLNFAVLGSNYYRFTCDNLS
jgi:hypothetical protein